MSDQRRSSARTRGTTQRQIASHPPAVRSPDCSLHLDDQCLLFSPHLVNEIELILVAQEE